MLTELVKYLVSRDKIAPVEASNTNPLLAPNDMGLHSLESLNQHRYRERYSFKTPIVQAFIDYTNERIEKISGAPIITVDPVNMSAHTIFNADVEGEAGHCDDTAKCNLLALPAWARLIRISQSDNGIENFSQRGLIDFIHDWHEHIEKPNELIAAFKKLTVERVNNTHTNEDDHSANRSTLEGISVRAELAPPPSEIQFSFTPYIGFEERIVTLSINSATDRRDNEVVLKVRVRGFEQYELDIANEFVSKLNDSLEPTVYTGTIKPA